MWVSIGLGPTIFIVFVPLGAITLLSYALMPSQRFGEKVIENIEAIREHEDFLRFEE